MYLFLHLYEYYSAVCVRRRPGEGISAFLVLLYALLSGLQRFAESLSFSPPLSSQYIKQRHARIAHALTRSPHLALLLKYNDAFEVNVLKSSYG